MVSELGHIDKKEKRVFAKGRHEDLRLTNEKKANTSTHAGSTADVECWGNTGEINHPASLGIHVTFNQDDPSGSGC